MVLNFTKNIVAGSGNIVLKNLSGGADVSLSVTDSSQVSVVRWQVTLTPSAKLLPGAKYAVQIPAGAVKDLFGNPCAAISDTTTYTFTTMAYSNVLCSQDFSANSTGWTNGGGAAMAINSAGQFAATANGSCFWGYTGIEPFYTAAAEPQNFAGDRIFTATVNTANAERAGMMFNIQGAQAGPTQGHVLVMSRSSGAVEFHTIDNNSYQFNLNGNLTLVKQTPFSVAANTSYTLQVVFHSASNTFDASVNGTTVFTGVAVTKFTKGSIGFAASYNGNGAWIDNVSITQPAQIRQLETESATVAAQTAGVTHRLVNDTRFSGGVGTILDATAAGNYVTYLVPNVAAGAYDVRVGIKKNVNRGIWQLSIGRADNFVGTQTAVGSPVDEYASGEVFTEVDLGSWTPGTTSDKWFQFKVTGENASASAFAISFDYIKLISQ